MQHLQLQALAFSKNISPVSFPSAKQKDCYVHVLVQMGEPANSESHVYVF